MAPACIVSQRRRFDEDKSAIRGEIEDTLPRPADRTHSPPSLSDCDTIQPACRKVVPLCAGWVNSTARYRSNDTQLAADGRMR